VREAKSRLFGKPRQQRTANDSVQKTDVYRQITWRIVLQPDFTQSHDYKDFDETSTTSLRHTGQFTWRKQIPWTCFHQNNYNTDFIRRNIYRPTEADATNRNPTPVTTVTIPYIEGTSETISRILQPYNIRVAHKPTTTLRHLLTNVKDRDEPNIRQGAVYKIKCSDCQASYIGETGRNLKTRLTEHKRATRNGDANNHIAAHHQLTNHNIDWDSARCLTYSTNYFQRLTLESWVTNLEQTPLKRCQQLPALYRRLFHDGNETDKRTSKNLWLEYLYFIFWNNILPVLYLIMDYLFWLENQIKLFIIFSCISLTMLVARPGTATVYLQTVYLLFNWWSFGYLKQSPLELTTSLMCWKLTFLNSLIIYQVKTKKITTVREVRIPGLN